jgi:ribokinase
MLQPSKIPAIATSLDRSNDLDEHVVGRAADVIASASLVVCQLEAPQRAAIEAFRIGREGGARAVLNPAPAGVPAGQLLSLTDVLYRTSTSHRLSGERLKALSASQMRSRTGGLPWTSW